MGSSSAPVPIPAPIPLPDPVKTISDTARNVYDGVRTGIDKAGEEINKGINKAGEEGNKLITRAGVEVGNGFRDVTGQTAMMRGMQAASDRQEAEANRLMWERDNQLAQNKETDAQAEARKRMRAAQAGGRSGTILTDSIAPTTQLGASGGKTLLGA